MSTKDEHWSRPAEHTSLKGRSYRGWDEGVYRLDSKHMCGYHLTLMKAGTKTFEYSGRRVGDRACVSERALGSSFKPVRKR